jgi:hypothetical protein
MTNSGLRSGFLAVRSFGACFSNARTAVAISIQAREALTQAPNPRCGLGVRPTSNLQELRWRSEGPAVLIGFDPPQSRQLIDTRGGNQVAVAQRNPAHG